MSSEIALYVKQLQEYEELIKANTKRYTEAIAFLKNAETTWIATQENAHKEGAPDALLKQIEEMLYNIDEIKKEYKVLYNRSLTNSQLVTENLFKLNSKTEEIKEKIEITRNEIFKQNQAPLFSAMIEESFSPFNYTKSIVKTLGEKYTEIVDYFKTNTDSWLSFIVVSILSLVFVLFYNKLYRHDKLFVVESSAEKNIFFFIGRPFATYTLLFVLGLVIVFADRPAVLGEFISIVLIIPVIRILQTIVKKENHRYIYTLFTLYFFIWFFKNSLDYELERRTFMLLVSIVFFIFMATVIRKNIILDMGQNIATKIIHYVLMGSLFFMAIAMGSNIYGSVLLSDRILNAILTICYSGMVFYVLYVILTGYIVLILRRRVSTASNMLDKYATKIEQRTTILIKIWMFLWWLLIVSKTVSLYPLLVTIEEIVFNFSFPIAQTIVSVHAIVDFILVVTGTWVVARFTRLLLEVEVFARFTLPRGVPTAILTTLNYIIIITGTIIAFSSLGVTPQQFALVFGALGVGIGFGLRNIIANFVSGIIMVFERPVQIGDTIEVENTMGNVQSIGARSSTIKTFDGSEVIIPNADFIAKEIINWTLSDEHRRKTVAFKVDLDNDIEEILEIMRRVAVSHKDVLKEPKPLATFKGFGEYYLEFKLYFWLSENLIVAHSEVTINLYKELREAGITMPVPQTNIHKLEN